MTWERRESTFDQTHWSHGQRHAVMTPPARHQQFAGSHQREANESGEGERYHHDRTSCLRCFPLPGPVMMDKLPLFRRMAVVLGRRYCRVRRASVIQITGAAYFILLR